MTFRQTPSRDSLFLPGCAGGESEFQKPKGVRASERRSVATPFFRSHTLTLSRSWIIGFRTSIHFLRRRWIRKTVLVFGFVLLSAAPLAHGQILTKIHRIAITNIGPQAASDSLVRANIRVKEGDFYSRNSIDDDVRNLYLTGFFYNIRVAEERTDEGVDLLYVLQGKPKLTDVLFTGNKKFSNAKLTKKLTSKIGEPLDERKLFADSQEIKKLYQKSGYPKTDCKYVLNIDERTGRGTATFEITETPKVRIVDVYFEGAHAFKQKKLRKVIKTRRHWMFSWITRSGVLKDEQLEDDKEKLAEFYRNEGYIDFELKEVRFINPSPRRLLLRFVVSEGRQYKVGAIDFKGVTLFSTNDILKKLKMTVGTVFTPGKLQKDIEAITDFYGAKGYIGKGTADHVPILAHKNANTTTGTMDLLYELEEGEKSYIEKIEIKGNVKTKDRVIRRELAVAPGEVFDMVKVKLSKARLEGLNYFDRIETQPEPTDVPDRRNLVVGVNEKTTGNFSVGAGFSSVDSILGFVEVTQGNFDLFNPPWFMGGGQKARLRLAYGAVRQDYTLSFVEPWFLGKKLAFSVDLYHHDLNNVSLNDLYSERRTGGRLGLTKALGSDFLIGGVSYTLERVNLYDVSTNASPVIQQEAGARTVSKIGSSLSFDTRNSVLFPNNGQRSAIRGELAGGPFGGDTDFYRVELRHSRYIKGFFEGHVLELLGRVGVVERYDDSPRVPLFDRWFLGGQDTLRGYRYRQVGPRDDIGEPLGGGTYWFGSAEYSVPIIERLRFAAFYDIGMVYTRAYSFDPNYVVPVSRSTTGYVFGQPVPIQLQTQSRFSSDIYNDNWGFGIRLNLPIGPLRLDYGIPIKHDSRSGSNGKFQFSVGYTRDF